MCRGDNGQQYIYVSGQFLFYDFLSAYCNFLLFHNFNPQKVVSFFIDNEWKKIEVGNLFFMQGYQQSCRRYFFFHSLVECKNETKRLKARMARVFEVANGFSETKVRSFEQHLKKPNKLKEVKRLEKSININRDDLKRLTELNTNTNRKKRPKEASDTFFHLKTVLQSQSSHPFNTRN